MSFGAVLGIIFSENADFCNFFVDFCVPDLKKDTKVEVGFLISILGCPGYSEV